VLVRSRCGSGAAGFDASHLTWSERVQRQNDPLAGTGLMQSPVEWAVRGRVLAGSLAGLIRDNLPALPGPDGIPYPDAYFDAAVLANVFEHITPDTRQQSLDEISRVLRPGGILAGQIPNPYFPIESHSRLPFMGFLPISLQRRYWRLSPVPWEHDFFVVTMRHLRRHAVASGFRVAHSSPFNYPPEAIPSRVRVVARMGAPLMRVFPWSWQFVLVKSD
jgi:SAM-dependent methyltransferase